MTRLIDEVLTQIMYKTQVVDDEGVLYISKPALNKLLSDYKDEFSFEYAEMGRDPNLDDLKEYLNVTILIMENTDVEEYQILAKV